MVWWVWTSAFGQEIGAADRAKIEARIEDLERAVTEGDAVAAIEVVPPRLLQAMLTEAGVSRAELDVALRESFAEVLTTVKFLDFGMDVAKATTQQTPDGSRVYLVIPTFTKLKVKDVGKVRTDTNTLALEDGGEWYLVRIDEAGQVGMLRKVFPEFTGVEFPDGKTSSK